MPATARGPRGARGEVREQLLAAARHQFTAHSFNSVTLKAIADEAGVDPGLISYYFGGKTGIFRESMAMPRDPGAVVMAALGENLTGAGERVLEAMFDQWRLAESSEAAGKLLVESLLESPETLETFRKWISEEIIGPVSRRLAGPNARSRAAAATGMVFQIMALRYLVKVEPIASLPEREVITLYAPLLQRLLTPAG